MENKLQTIKYNFFSVFFVLFFCLQFSLFAEKTDTITFTGFIVNNNVSLPSKTINLNPYNSIFKKYETKIKPDNSFQFKIPVAETEFYEVLYGGFSKSILFSKNEPNPGFKIVLANGKPPEMYITNSFENVAHEILRNNMATLRDTLKGFRASCIADKTICAKYWADLTADYNMHIQQIINDYPKTFTAQVIAPMALCPMLNKQKSPVEQMEKHYFDGINFSDTRLFYTSDIAVKFIGYLNDIADTSRQGRYAFINDMFMKAMGNEEANKKLGLALYNVFSQTNREEYLETMGDWLDTRPWAEEQLPSIVAALKSASKIKAGSIAPEIIASDNKGSMKKLSDVVKNSKLTLAIFWSSDCSHCIEATPEIKKTYEKYHQAGFNIYAASLDANSEQWKKFISDNNLGWTNVNVGQSNPALESYNIKATPSMALIDKKGIIIQRILDVKNLESEIEKVLKAN